ncbi:MAG: methyltransferase domain-containing protein [Ferruginibacter sp.]
MLLLQRMSRFHSYLLTAKNIIDSYKGEQPFPFHLKQFFAGQKKYGSKDRKLIGACCYAWWRSSWLFGKKCTDNNLERAVFLCNALPAALMAGVGDFYHGKENLSSLEKLQLLDLDTQHIFPFTAALGNINGDVFALSFLQQPDLFIRLRPGKEKQVLQKLENASISFNKENNDCIALSNATKLEDFISLNREAVVQDRNSQRVLDDVKKELPAKNVTDAWDCCAASGGKSILLYDRLQTRIKLTVSDIRPGILHNCKKRLQEAGINIHHAFVTDMSQPVKDELVEDFDIIICDAPCTGSGTWSRTPEQLAFFDASRIETFATLQKSIAGNAAAHLRKGGLFVYITCSVFAGENEAVVTYLQNNPSLELISNRYLEGAAHKADTMFVALFRAV